MYKKKFRPMYRPGFGNYGKSLEQTAYEVINRIKKRKYAKVNFFDGYRYPALDALYFNLLINGRKFDIRSASKRDITEHYHKHIKEIVEQDRNLIGMCTGKPGLGKSLITMSVCVELSDDHIEFNKTLPEDKQKQPFIDYSFDFGGSQKKIKKLKEGQCLIQDEIHDQSGEMSRTVMTALKNLVKSFRWTQKSFMINNPDYVYIPALNLIISPVGQSDKFFKTNNPDDMNTRIWIRYVDDTQQHKMPIYLGYAVINVAKAFETEYKKYLSLKHKDYNHLENHGGLDSVKMDEEEFQRDIEELEKIALENGWDGKSKTELGRYLQMSDISYDTTRKKYLLIEVYKRQKKREKEQAKQRYQNIIEHKQEDKVVKDKMLTSETFVAPDDYFLNKILTEKTDWDNPERDVEIYRLAKEGERVITLAKKYGITEPAVNHTLKKVIGFINDARGKLYEEYKAELLRKTNKYRNVIHDGAPGKPDIYAETIDYELHIFSCKVIDLSVRHHRQIPIDKFRPEIEYGFEKIKSDYKDVKVFYSIFEISQQDTMEGEFELTKPLPNSIKYSK